MKVTAKKKKEIIELRKQGKTYTAISLLIGVARDTIQEVIKENEKR